MGHFWASSSGKMAGTLACPNCSVRSRRRLVLTQADHAILLVVNSLSAQPPRAPIIPMFPCWAVGTATLGPGWCRKPDNHFGITVWKFVRSSLVELPSTSIPPRPVLPNPASTITTSRCLLGAKLNQSIGHGILGRILFLCVDAASGCLFNRVAVSAKINHRCPSENGAACFKLFFNVFHACISKSTDFSAEAFGCS